MNVNLKFELELNPNTTYPLQEQTHPLLEMLRICNGGDTLDTVTLRIASTGTVLIPFEVTLPLLEAGAVTEVPQVQQLRLDPNYKTFHKLTTEMVLSLYQADRLLYSQAVQFHVLPAQSPEEADPAEEGAITP